jgi:AcrR family transcriptional regulator
MSELPASRRLGRPSNVDSAETRCRLLEAARRVFASQGYEATTNRQIADEAGLTTGAIYHYVPSKADLYAAVYLEVQERVSRAFEQAITDETSLLDRFNAMLDATVSLNCKDPSLPGFVVAVSSESQRHPELMERVRAMQTTSSFVRRLVEDAAAAGELPPDTDLRAVEDMFHAIFMGLARFSLDPKHVDRHRAAVAAMQRLLAGTLLVNQAPQQAGPGRRRARTPSSTSAR